MFGKDSISALLAMALTLPFGVSYAQSTATTNPVPSATKDAAPASRMQVKMERDEFLKTHVWQNVPGVWVLKSGVEPPVGVKSREAVKSDRDMFLSKNRWDNLTTSWIPRKEGPREMSTLSRQQVRTETAQFLKTHEFEEVQGIWVEKPIAKGK